MIVMRIHVRISTFLGLLFGGMVVSAIAAQAPSEVDAIGIEFADRPTINISGEWQFRMDPEEVGHEQRWYDPDTAFDRTITVPGAWNAQGMEYGSPEHGEAWESQQYRGRLPGVEREDETLYHVFHISAEEFRQFNGPITVLINHDQRRYHFGDSANIEVADALREQYQVVLLDQVPVRIDPIVRSIDMPQRLLNKAYLFEASVGEGRLLVSGFNFSAALAAEDPAGQTLLDQLIDYDLGPDFAPSQRLPVAGLAAEFHSRNNTFVPQGDASDIGGHQFVALDGSPAVAGDERYHLRSDHYEYTFAPTGLLSITNRHAGVVLSASDTPYAPVSIEIEREGRRQPVTFDDDRTRLRVIGGATPAALEYTWSSPDEVDLTVRIETVDDAPELTRWRVVNLTTGPGVVRSRLFRQTIGHGNGSAGRPGRQGRVSRPV
jgi:hypothetical protein